MSNDLKRAMDDLMISIPGGEVDLRDDRIQRKWKAELKPFRLGRYPVTSVLYDAVSGHSSGDTLCYSLDHSLLSNGDNRIPAVNISWQDAIAFCNRLSRLVGLQPCYSTSDNGETIDCDWDAAGYRLPSEAEWQYACKAGTTGYRYGELDKIAWYSGNSADHLHEAGGKEPNVWGLHDMLGNVWEWCWDLYDEHVYGSYRIFRGGSWAEEARGCGATVRRRSHPTFRIDDLGFRLAQSKS
ncbi:formylglycine-generating enzyme family protein [Paenibacillus sacheonensis]|uniref:SUMF1/EgtB/PvdO family nonheme iron enzyme n=1 Tax=Paenibacillus sacheonensis TaxID=742054 RepID=A0A7X4YLB4_9BACL|nr:SUMF1/EgtB/PvdO family nonheme iron enzyme [Paenibacillus sacheonensis]MBM7568784.1 formylglycine-generating enzyme required for sulfatase activity [Paenibacillus sacheonensis]NBC68382.1 SUMF1/EgtB/PvdO family nonheme iron enzyme [Paenibacillus sacheonensis]